MRQDDLPDLAGFLLEPAGTIPSDPQRWSDLSAARLRTAVNRAYYGLFLFLKFKLEGARYGWALPRNAVHAKVRKALETGLGHSHSVTQGFRDLQRERGVADYHLDKAFSDSEVEDVIAIALETMQELQSLGNDLIQKVAGELVDIDREWRKYS